MQCQGREYELFLLSTYKHLQVWETLDFWSYVGVTAGPLVEVGNNDVTEALILEEMKRKLKQKIQGLIP